MKTRTRLIIVLAAALLLTSTIILVPRIIEARRLKAVSAEQNLAAVPVLTRFAGLNQKGGEVIVGASVKNDVSPPLRDMKQMPVGVKYKREANENPKLPGSLTHKDSADPVVQGASSLLAFAGLNMPSPLLNFDGIFFPGVACNCAPPDTNGEVGATQYVQMVNEGFQVFNKTTGASVLGPSGITTLWAGFGGVCQNNGSGDPVVLYDQLANRWVITQFAGVSVPTDECIAVSTTSDATGSYFRYAFHLGSNFFDYPHLSVWPDAYYMAMNVFNASGTAFLGPQPFAFDRAKMLAGLPATFISTGITGGPGEETYLPADLDGSILPAAGAPATFVEWPGTGAYQRLPFPRRFRDARQLHLYALRQHCRRGLHGALPDHAQLRAPARHDQPARRHWRSLDVPARLSQFRHTRIRRWELHGELRWRSRDTLVRAAQRDQWTSDEVSGKHLPAGHDLALDGQRGDGPAGQSGPRLQRLERVDQPADPLCRAAL